MTPTFTKQPDGSVTVDGWTDEIEIHPEYLTKFDPKFLVYDGGRSVRISVSNGTAHYDGDFATAVPGHGDLVWRGTLVACEGPRA